MTVPLLTETLLTVTFDSVQGLKKVVDELREGYEQLISHLRNRDEIQVDFIEETIEQQTELIDEIERSQDGREKLENQEPDQWDARKEELQSLRDKAETLLKERLQDLDSQLDSLDKNLEVMEKYKTDGENNYFLDETI
jgi:chromosome segregation ATPase